MKHQMAHAAATRLIRYLEEEYIIETCKGDPMLACVSCQAIALVEQIKALRLDIEENYPEDGE